MAEHVELADQATCLSRPAGSLEEVVRSEVGVLGVVGEHVPDRGQDRVADGDRTRLRRPKTVDAQRVRSKPAIPTASSPTTSPSPPSSPLTPRSSCPPVSKTSRVATMTRSGARRTVLRSAYQGVGHEAPQRRNSRWRRAGPSRRVLTDVRGSAQPKRPGPFRSMLKCNLGKSEQARLAGRSPWYTSGAAATYSRMVLESCVRPGVRSLASPHGARDPLAAAQGKTAFPAHDLHAGRLR